MSPPHSYPEACGWNQPQIDAFAAEKAKTLGFSPGDELEPIIEKLGGTFGFRSPAYSRTLPLFDEPEWQPDADSIVVRGPGDFSISASSQSSLLRNRFTIAHELGHYFLHSDEGKKPIYAGRTLENKRVEWEANWFAASFLMPRAAFCEAREKLGDHPYHLAGRFLVSEQAARVRLKSVTCDVGE